MQIKSFTFNPFQTNCYVLSDSAEAVIVDPSASSDAEMRVIREYIDTAGLTVKHVLLTHAHIDHIFGVADACSYFDVGYLMHRSDLLLMQGAAEQGRLFGVEIDQPGEPAGFLDEDSTIAVGGEQLTILHTPGHSPGSITFVADGGEVAVAGDVLFAGSIGRTDLWQGSLPVLMRSIFDKLVPLGEQTRVLPGHGPATTVGVELQSNPFLTGSYELK
ncbi:MAG: MBL fold metallo-hydrolase [Rhodothermia bacterium]|nr:MBL fold metallo-hydrolase [Rhodothermia bacterium]